MIKFLCYDIKTHNLIALLTLNLRISPMRPLNSFSSLFKEWSKVPRRDSLKQWQFALNAQAKYYLWEMMRQPPWQPSASAFIVTESFSLQWLGFNMDLNHEHVFKACGIISEWGKHPHIFVYSQYTYSVIRRKWRGRGLATLLVHSVDVYAELATRSENSQFFSSISCYPLCTSQSIHGSWTEFQGITLEYILLSI